MYQRIKTSLHQNFVVFAKSPALLILLIMPLSLLFLIGSITPVAWILPHIITLSIIVICFLSVGVQYNEYRKANFFRTVKSSKMSTVDLVLGTFIVTFVVAFFLSISLMVVAWFFTMAIPILSQTIDNIKIDAIEQWQSFLQDDAFLSTFSFENVKWLWFIYSIIISIAMTSLIAIMVGNVIRTTKGYILFSILYIILFVLLSGLSIPLHLITSNQFTNIAANLLPNFHTNALISSSINSGVAIQSAEYSTYLDNIAEWLKSTYEGGEVNFYFPPELEGEDPFDMTIIYSTFPFLLIGLTGIVDLVNGLFGFLGPNLQLNLEPNMASFLGVTFMITNFLFKDTYIANASQIVYQLSNLSLAFSSVYSIPYTFNYDMYSLTKNLLPIIFMLLSVPSFILVVRY